MEDILVQLEYERQKLSDLVDELSKDRLCTNNMVIIQSQKLDKLILKFMKENLKKSYEEQKYGENTGTC